MEKVFENNNNSLFKILPCLLIAMYAIMCLFGSTVCATDVTVDGNTYSLSDEISSFKYLATFKDGNYFYIICADKPFVFYSGGEDGGGYTIWYIGFPNRDSTLYYKSVWFTDFSEIPSYTLSDFDKTDACSSPFSRPEKWTKENATSNFDIKNVDGDVVFQGASPELAGVTISAIQSAEEIPQAIIKTMKVVIPVGLLILGIGLVIYLIKSVILRMQ